jgi:hypothetical protein
LGSSLSHNGAHCVVFDIALTSMDGVVGGIGVQGRVRMQFIKCCETGVRTGSVNHVGVAWANIGDTDVPANLIGLDIAGGL